MGCTHGSVLYLHSDAAALSPCPSPLRPCIHASIQARSVSVPCSRRGGSHHSQGIPYLPQKLAGPVRFNLRRPLSQENRSLRCELQRSIGRGEPRGGDFACPARLGCLYPSPASLSLACYFLLLFPTPCALFAVLQEAASKTGVEKAVEKAACEKGLKTPGAEGEEAEGHV